MGIADTLDLPVAPFAHERVTRVRGHRPWPLQAAEAEIDTLDER